MQNRKIIQCVSNKNQKITPQQTIQEIKNAGFDGVFIQWYNKDWQFSQQQQVDLCKQLNLSIQFAHLSYNGINDLWFDGEKGDKLIDNYMKDLDECKKNNIDMVVMHITCKYETPQPSQIGIQRLQKLVDYAEKLNIKVAFENTRLFGYLEFVFQHIKNKNAGVCFDTGHYHCYYNDKFNWHLFKDRIFAVHIHDNDGTDDQHLLAFDGTLNWQDIMQKLKQANYNGPITLESNYRNTYTNSSAQQYFSEAYNRAKKLRDLI